MAATTALIKQHASKLQSLEQAVKNKGKGHGKTPGHGQTPGHVKNPGHGAAQIAAAAAAPAIGDGVSSRVRASVDIVIRTRGGVSAPR